MKEYRIRSEHALTGKLKCGKVSSQNLERVIKVLASYGYVVYLVIGL